MVISCLLSSVSVPRDNSILRSVSAALVMHAVLCLLSARLFFWAPLQCDARGPMPGERLHHGAVLQFFSDDGGSDPSVRFLVLHLLCSVEEICLVALASVEH